MRSEQESSAKLRLLYVDRDPAPGRLLAADLCKIAGTECSLSLEANGRTALSRLRADAHDLVVVDLASLGDLSELADEAVGRIARAAQGAILVAVSNGRSVSAAVEAMRGGAHDYVTKPFSGEALAQRLEELSARHGRQRACVTETVPIEPEEDFAAFVGRSPQMQMVYEQIQRIAPSSAPVFITGESGTGKELCARALHERGSRAKSPFIAINCGAIPRDLMESELFGVAKGAFTGANVDRKGAAELAHGGTLFLDEIGEMDLGMQTKLLRFLQTGSVTRLGEGVERTVDVRVICATNRNPMHLISERKFREDLFYRLHVLPIHLPPLRQRPDDILPLAEHFLTRYSAMEHKHFCRLDAQTRDIFIRREWPGNVRQLQNLIRRVVVMFDGTEICSEMISTADIEMFGHRGPSSPPTQRSTRSQRPERREILPMWQQEMRIIEDALTFFDGNISQAAAALEISPSTIYRKKQAWDGKQPQMLGAA